MANERLRSALSAAGMTIAELSEQIDVDPKTVERWILAGRLPHRANRQAVSAALRRGEDFLWPESISESRSRSASQAEFIELHPSRGAVPATTWRTMLEDAKESVDL